jgi:hypothetical protein
MEVCMAVKVLVTEFTGVVLDKSEGDKEYRIHEWELDDGTFEYGLNCPLHSSPLPSTLPEIYPQHQHDVVCPACTHKYLLSESKAVFRG